MNAMRSPPPGAPNGAEPLTQRACAALIAALQSGALRSGQFLSIPQLVEQMGMPIAAVRDAVKQASAMGLVETFAKRGVQVMDARPDVIRDCLNFRMMLDQEGARRLIASDRELNLANLRAAHERMRDAAGDDAGPGLPARAIATDLSLHDYMAAGLNNPLATEAYEANRIRIAIIQNVRPFLLDRIRSAMTEHLAIIDGLERRDAPATVGAIEDHCEKTLRWWGVT
jgi:DNA-binding GntR family transcriptional regulator